ncbi:MAG: sulfatase-like hydrolase/transferase [Ferruginibacter sp.]|nr:sulfatase-like hydrolase/transferase [Chitinophagaceae bacterium]
MKDKLLHIVRTKPIFLYLLPPFFVLHGFTENYDFIPAKDAFVLTCIYTGASLLFSLLCWLLYRNFIKANLAAFFIMGFQFFFGSIHDSLKKIFPGSFITKYQFILPAAALLFIILLIVLKKRRSTLLKLTYYLNVLLLLLVLADTALLTSKVISKKKPSYSLPAGFIACKNCPQPDVYFILADEYAGNTELKDLFRFDDSAFLHQLAGLGFHTIPESRSNYNYTPFSVASLLNMNYLDLEGNDRTKPDLTYCYEAIRDNQLLRFLRFHDYDFYNYSVFDFEGQPARVRETFLPVKTRLITSQTFLSRFDKEIRFNFVYRWKSKKNLEILTYANKKNNENIYDLTWKLAGKKTTNPKFVYTHLMMPHYPYYFDRNGKEQPFENLLEGNQVNKAAYIEYLQYTNKELIKLVDHILQSSASPPLIVLMGDHGFRHFMQPVESKYYFLNLSSVYLPSGNYTGFSDSLTGVNLFRTVLNSAFGQRMPYLEDSTSYLRD